VAASSLILLAAPVGTGSAGATPNGAPGNNGTVKIHEGAGEPTPEVQNQPHVCTFHVHAFFFDAGQVLSFTVQSWEPTGDGSVVLSGTITADDSGEGRTPGAYELPDGHYRLTVDTGNGTPTQDKHKMFWVTCATETPSSPPPTTPTSPPPTTPTSPPPTSPTMPTSPPPTTPTSPGETSPTMPSSPPPTSPTSPGATSPTSPVPPPTSPGGLGPVAPTPGPGGGLPQTGSTLLPIAGLGLALLLAGIALTVFPIGRRQRFRG
jgi:hypothetical protein